MAETQGGVGILGGTFDPIHLGHLIIAEEARSRLGLEQIIFVPAGDPYRREHSPQANTEQRLAMVRRAVADNPAFRVSTVDIDRGGPSYSVDTVRDIRRELGDDPVLCFLMGWDALRDLHTWHRPDLLADLAQIVVLLRPGLPEMDWAVLERVLPGAQGRILRLNTPVIGISATEVRRRVAERVSLRYWVPDLVAEYIVEHGLYCAAAVEAP